MKALLSVRYFFFTISDPAAFWDIVLTALIVGLIGAIGYTLILDSMNSDRKEGIANKQIAHTKEKYGVGLDLWGSLEGQDREEEHYREVIKEGRKKRRVLILVFTVLLVTVLIIKFAF